jgi:hypothetical protein
LVTRYWNFIVNKEILSDIKDYLMYFINRDGLSKTRLPEVYDFGNSAAYVVFFPYVQDKNGVEVEIKFFCEKNIYRTFDCRRILVKPEDVKAVIEYFIKEYKVTFSPVATLYVNQELGLL